jgi:SAM-dependent methyltransferase
MHYSILLAAGEVKAPPPLHATAVFCRQSAAYRPETDRRWPMIVRKLTALRRRGRRSLRVIDVRCGAGDLLFAVARQARALGFVAIEGRGVDPDAAKIGAAAAACRRHRDPASDFIFEQGDGRAALREEAEFPADFVLYPPDEPSGPALSGMVRSAGSLALCA